MREVGGGVAEGDDPLLKSHSLALKVWLHKPVLSSFWCCCESSIGRRLHDAWPVSSVLNAWDEGGLRKSTYTLELEESKRCVPCAQGHVTLKQAMRDKGPAVTEVERHSQLG
jgi:hypothetical protein